MNLDKIKKFIQLAKTEGVSELKYEEKDFKVAVNFSVQASAGAFISHTTPTQQTESSAATIDKNVHLVTSPFVGTFYSSASPGRPSFAKVGDNISNGQTLCILEAMKIMNEIEADCSGELLEICVENESLVEFGQVLFKIRK